MTTAATAAPTAGSDAGATPRGASDGDADAYFAELLGYSLDRLSREPDLLKADADRLDRAATESALAHRSAFPAAAAALASAAAALADADAAASRLRRHVPRLGDAADAFARAAPGLAARRVEDAKARAAAPALAPLLAAPALAAAAAAAGALDAALDVRGVVGRVALLHPGAPAARALDAAAARAADTARASLLDRLASPVHLADCLRCVGYLRRLRGPGGEAGLRADFLSARGRFLDAAAAAATASDGAPSPASTPDAVKRVTDAHRRHLFDVVMQYRAVFGGGGGGGGEGDGFSSSTAAVDAALSAWVADRTATYLASLDACLPCLPDGPSLGAALEHASYAGASLARAGADARAALAPLFEAAALRLWTRALDSAVASFEAGLDAHSWVALPAPPRPPPAAGAGAGAPPPPPYSALAHAPVARLVNAFAAALNDLRACAPSAAGPLAADALTGALARLAAAAAGARAARAATPAAAAAADAAAVVADAVLPHARECFGCVYPDDVGRVDVAGAAALIRESD